MQAGDRTGNMRKTSITYIALDTAGTHNKKHLLCVYCITPRWSVCKAQLTGHLTAPSLPKTNEDIRASARIRNVLF